MHTHFNQPSFYIISLEKSAITSSEFNLFDIGDLFGVADF